MSTPEQLAAHARDEIDLHRSQQHECVAPLMHEVIATLDAARESELDVERLGMAMDLTTEEDDRIGVVGRGRYAERVAARYAALRFG